jgi:hypothetical protein
MASEPVTAALEYRVAEGFLDESSGPTASRRRTLPTSSPRSS